MKKTLALIMAVIMMLGLMAGCGADNGEAGAASSGKKAACILGVGGLGDQSFNDLIYAGMERARDELGIDFDYAEPKQVADFEQIMRDMSDSGEYCVILCVGFDQVDPLTRVHGDYPEQMYAVIDGTVEGDNVVSYNMKEQEGSFLVGALAAMMKEDAATYNLLDNNQLGFIGALEIPTIRRFAAGFQAGAQYINPEMQIDFKYVGGDNPFGDTTTAKEIALGQFDKGCDIIYHAAGGSGLGLFSAAKEAGFYAIGCNSNQNSLDPDHIIASMLKRVDSAAYETVKAAAEGTLQGGAEVNLGVAENGISYTLENSNIKVSDDIVAKLTELEQKIGNGEIEVPATY